MAKSFQKYGLPWARGTNDYTIEKWCFRNNHPREKGGLGPYGHFRNAIQVAFSKNEFKYHSFVDTAVADFIKNDKYLMQGSGGVGKSTTIAVIGLIYFDCDPKLTTVTIFTSTAKKQDLRAFGMMVEYHEKLQRRYGDIRSSYKPSEQKIAYDDPTDKKGTSKKGGIFAFNTFNADEVRKANAQSGVHNKYNLRLYDEMNACDDSVVGQTALANYWMSGEEQKLIGAANPFDWNDNFSKFALPVQGVENIDENTGSWMSTSGFFVRHFNVLKCPRYTEPNGNNIYEGVFPAYSGIQHIIDTFGKGSFAYSQQVLGFIPASSLKNDTALTRAMCEEGRVTDGVVFKRVVGRLAAFDPASTEGGDKKILTFADLGVTHSGRMELLFLEQIELKPTSSETVEFTKSMCLEVIRQCEQRGVAKCQLGVDASGTDGICDSLDVLWQGTHEDDRVYRCYFAGTASNMSVSLDDGRPRKAVYDRKVTELYMNVRNFTLSQQLKRLSEKAITQFCNRKLGKRYGKWSVEPKNKMADKSPDHADSVCVMVDMCVQNLGFSSSMSLYGNKPDAFDRFKRQIQPDYSNHRYNTESESFFQEDTLYDLSIH